MSSNTADNSQNNHDQQHEHIVDNVPTEAFWKSKYPPALNSELNFNQYKHLLDVFSQSCKKYADKPAFSNMDHVMTYAELDEYSSIFAGYLQKKTNLQKGDRIAIQLPNVLQYPVVLFGAIKAGLVIVNTNPLYTAREMKHQFNDSGAKALVVLDHFANLAQEVVPETNIKNVIVCRLGDMMPRLKRYLVNFVVKRVKKMVPEYNMPTAVMFRSIIKNGSVNDYTPVAEPNADDIAVIQYTGGTTGVAKGAMLTHRNLVSNMMQTNAILSDFKRGEEVMVVPLPLYHIFCFTVSCMAVLELGCHSLLITNPRDIPGFIKTLQKNKFTSLAGLNTLFVGLMKNEGFKDVDWSNLKLTVSGGMALQSSVAKRWADATGCEICEGYGMTESSPVACANPPDAIQVGTIGLPVAGTLAKIIGEDGQTLPMGEQGELCIKGPQVMKGYWERPDATADTIEDGWLKTGDIALIQEDGYIKIVDRKKDMILVSGFNVYPNEVEDVVAGHPKVLESAAIGVPCEKSGEKIKLFVVRKDPSLTEQEIIEFARKELTGYKVPKIVEFRDELPKTNVGKILRRKLRDEQEVKTS
ncbi:MAG: long-chain fatty acid--CoA ligase [Gammaproteobacteria bacterium]|nr:long-chain fatty acid--CoA ligase [Gammaproteobacteria bacterium]|tara:strand:+ start:6112 stop:7860 length:1749 start_codon:yes stop_codon:yes gene_type:complete